MNKRVSALGELASNLREKAPKNSGLFTLQTHDFGRERISSLSDRPRASPIMNRRTLRAKPPR